MKKTPITRRNFIKGSTFAALSIHPLIATLSNISGCDEDSLKFALIEEKGFHYFDNNLTNLHFYFINVEFKNNKVRKLNDNSGAYMIVRIPQQHISEQIFKESEAFPGGIYNESIAETKISGFSYLAFKFLKEKNSIEIEAHKLMNLLLDWNNREIFELIIPEPKDYIKKNDPEFKGWSFKEQISESNFNYYKDVISNFFKKNNEGLFYATVLEIPQGLFLTPYNRIENTKAKFDKLPSIARQEFIYKEGKVYFSVEEVWNSRLWIEKIKTNENSEILENPVLRAFGYVTGEEGSQHIKDGQDCPPSGEKFDFLPTITDKKDITTLTSLARDNNKDEIWDIKTKVLTFTGLGSIAKFKYKNLNPPEGEPDLVEYEHHITLGRDEFIKVSRLGVISLTGQKALHIKIGERKIKNGVSYVDYKQYIEIIEKEKIYNDESFIKNGIIKTDETDIKDPQWTKMKEKNIKPEPDNYIDVRIDLETKKYTHSSTPDDSFWSRGNNSDSTNFRRFPFKKITSITTLSSPIIPDNSPDSRDIIKDCGNCKEQGDSPHVFWPVLEKDGSNLNFDFKGIDWNDKEIYFSGTFMFIRMYTINDQTEKCISKIYENFNTVSEKFKQRRQIDFKGQSIAYTYDYDSEIQEEHLNPNKSNIAETDFIEFYFSICKEDKSKIKDIFQTRCYPIFPQVKYSKIYIENIQGYSNEKIPALIEYNKDFIQYGFIRAKSLDSSKPEEFLTYNKAKLIFDLPIIFRNDENKLIEIDERLKGGYKKIKNVFSSAGDKIGALVNPDIDIESIGVVKQAILVAKNLNEKYEKVSGAVNKIENFNPTDLLRGKSAEIFGGISLLDILQEVLPINNTPFTEIKNITTQLESIKSTVLDEINSEIKAASEYIEKIKKEVESYQNTIKELEEVIKQKKDLLSFEHQFAEIQKIVNDSIEKYKLIFINKVGEEIKLIEEDAKKFIANEILSKMEIFENINNFFEEYTKIVESIEPEAKNIIRQSFSNAKTYFSEFCKIIYKIDSVKGKIFYTYVDILNIIHTGKIDGQVLTIGGHNYPGVKNYVEILNNKNNILKELIVQQSKLLERGVTEDVKNKYLELKKKFETELEKFSEFTNELKNRIEEIKIIKTSELSPESEKIVELIKSRLLEMYDLFLSFEIPYSIDKYESLTKDLSISISKIKFSVDKIVEIIINSNSIMKTTMNDICNVYIMSISEAFNPKEEINKVILSINKHVQEFRKNIQNRILSGAPVLIPEKVNSILYELIISYTAINEFIDEISKLEKDLIGVKQKLQSKVEEYENALLNKVTEEAGNILMIINKRIVEWEKSLLQETNTEEINKLTNKIIEARRILQILTSLSKKEIVYTWNTNFLKNANFGIVSFVKYSNPDTTLSVNVKNSIYFEPEKFPSVVSKIESVAENVLTNFGISFLQAVTLNFKEVKFSIGTGQDPKFDVKIRDVQFAGSFSFVQAFESFLKSLLGDAFHLKLQPTNVNIGYSLPIPSINTPAFSFFDLTLNFDFWLYFDNKPMEFGFSLGTKKNMFGIAVGIFAGFGYFSILLTPKEGIRDIEVGLDFGGRFKLSLGPISGEVKLAVGLYYSKKESVVIIEGHFICEGYVNIWIVMISVRFYMGIKSQGGYVEGRCSVSYSIRLGFFKKSFEATYYKKLAGASPGNTQAFSDKQFNNYIQAVKKVNLTKEKVLEELKTNVNRKVRTMELDQWEIFINSYIK